MDRPVTWIRHKVKSCDDIQEMYDLHATFQKETGSSAELTSYKRAVRKYFFDRHGEPAVGAVRIKREAEGPNLNIVTTSAHIRTLEQLLAYANVDLGAWEVTKHVVNSWGSEANTNYQVKVWMQLRESKVDERELIRALMDDAKKYAPEYPKVRYRARPSSGYMFELSLYDHHFGQMSWGDETGSVHYDCKKARKLALLAVEHQLSRAQDLSPERILVIVGNDFFNVNSQDESTAHGTRQAEDDRWHKTFLAGRKLWVEILEMCMQIAPVDVLVIPGNHDEERIFYLGDALECWFDKCDDVQVFNGPKKRKYYLWGKCLLGFTHGSEERKGKGVLVNLMATEMPAEWAISKYRTWRKGHTHAANALAFQVLDEELGVREEVMPSMVALDDYHAGKGYSHLRETIGNAWHKELGRTDQFMYHPPEGM